MDSATLGRRLKALREANLLTQDQLAEVLGVSRSHVSRAENGTALNVLTVGELQAWAERCGTTVGEVLQVAPPDWRTDTVRGVASKVCYDLDAPEACGAGVVAAVDALQAQAREAWADLAEVRRWANAGPGGCAPYGENVAGMLERLDESFRVLGGVEDSLRQQLDDAKKAKRELEGQLADAHSACGGALQAMNAAQDRLRLVGERLVMHGIVKPTADVLDVDLAVGVELLVGHLKERIREAQAEALSSGRRATEAGATADPVRWSVVRAVTLGLEAEAIDEEEVPAASVWMAVTAIKAAMPVEVVRG